MFRWLQGPGREFGAAGLSFFRLEASSPHFHSSVPFPMEFFRPARYTSRMSSPEPPSPSYDAADLALLRPLAREIQNIDFAVAEIARFSAELTLPKGTIHVISDIHGEDKK